MLYLVLKIIVILVAKLPERTTGLEKAAKFIMYRDFRGVYRWRLRSLAGETIAVAAMGHYEKSECTQELEHWRLEYPDVPIRDATVWSPERQLSLEDGSTETFSPVVHRAAQDNSLQ
jgi:uncharacterized protein YegP (UPF0339 family)